MNYNVTVNGKVYSVTVEKTGAAAPRPLLLMAAPVAAPVAAPPLPLPPRPAAPCPAAPRSCRRPRRCGCR